MRILGLTGKMGAGKDYLFRKLHQTFPYAERWSFADGVKLDIEEVLGKNPLPGLWHKPYAPEVRRLLQWWGTDLRRREDEDFWVDYLSERLARSQLTLPEEARLVVITDVRFLNEAGWIQDQGGKVVRVIAPDLLRAERLGRTEEEVRALSFHPSEREVNIIKANYEVLNNDNDDFAALSLERYVAGWLVSETL